MWPSARRMNRMTTDYWTAAFTIVVDGIQVDFTELPEQKRVHILRSLFAGETNGTLEGSERLEYEKAVS